MSIWFVLPLILIGWGIVAHAVIAAMSAKAIETFVPPALCAALASFLFLGPACIVVWYLLIMRMIWLGSKL